MSLENKRILITAGPTWVPIDAVRVISNTATGETGILLADKLQRLGARVTLLLGPVAACCLDRRIRLVRFKFFDELKSALLKELASHKYDAVIHAAAVSDYMPEGAFRKKIGSDKKRLDLKLWPTPKLIDAIKKISRGIYLVGFKFEPNTARGILVKKTRDMMKRAGADLAVANTVCGNRYQAYIVSKDTVEGPIKDKKGLTERLVKRL